MISLGKILHFLLKNSKNNLKKYLGKTPDGKKFKINNTGIINNCKQYFDEQEIDQPASQIKTRINHLINKQYCNAYRVLTQSGEGSYGFDNSVRRLNDICPDLFRLKEIMQTRMTKSLCVSNSDKPVSFAREYGMSSATRKEISVKDKKQDNGDEIAILEPVSKDEHHLLDALDFIAPLIVGTAGKNPSLALNTSGDDSLLALGPTSNLLTSSLVPEMTKSKKRDSTHAQLVKEREKAVDKKLKVMDAAAKAFQDKKIAIKEAYFLKVREDHWKKETLDADMNMILGMASLFYWSEKKIREEYA
ncbi:hypothetical protein F4703DRAFT_1931068 [Phycomyces blakesleeanus]